MSHSPEGDNVLSTCLIPEITIYIVRYITKKIKVAKRHLKYITQTKIFILCTVTWFIALWTICLSSALSFLASWLRTSWLRTSWLELSRLSARLSYFGFSLLLLRSLITVLLILSPLLLSTSSPSITQFWQFQVLLSLLTGSTCTLWARALTLRLSEIVPRRGTFSESRSVPIRLAETIYWQ